MNDEPHIVEPSGRPRPSTAKSLSARRSLVEIMREHQFGRIENMTVRDGEPVFDHHLKLVRLVRLNGRSRGQKTLGADEFELKDSVRDLFAEFARLEVGDYA
jgi:hypothetical protein